MIDPHCSIMVVDDARFSSAMITRALKKSGFNNIHVTNSSQQALEELEKNPTNILIADWLMPGMDGLELTDRIRQLDESCNHFTYILLLTAKEGPSALEEAFDRQVDDFIHKSDMNEELPSRMFAAQRISTMQNKLLRQNLLLLENNQKLRSRNLVDGLTGLGNGRYALKMLKQNLKLVKEREQACCLLLINLYQPDRILDQYNSRVLEEITRGVARRLSQLVRPLDIVARLQPTQFAVITTQPSLHHLSCGSFKRIHDGLNLKAFKTSSGFVSASASTTLCGVDPHNANIEAKQLLIWLQKHSSEQQDTSRTHECEYLPESVL